MQAGSDVYKVVTGKRDVIYAALYRAVLATRTQITQATERGVNPEEDGAPQTKRGLVRLQQHIEILEERLEHYSKLKAVLFRTHWRRLLATDFQEWIEDLLEQVLGYQYDYDPRLPSKQRIVVNSWDMTWQEVRHSIKRTLELLVRLALSVERINWEKATRPQKQPRPLEYRPQISPNAPAL